MYRINTMNKIAAIGLNNFDRDNYEVASELNNPDAIIVRSAKMNDMELPETLKAIARAGAGVNNIPVEKCSEQGIVVFNTPGANANAVKEIVTAALLLASRKIYEGITWANRLKGQEDIGKKVEEGKKNFAGGEIKGKTLGVIGLGAIGVNVANVGIALNMDVIGYDPFISVESAWGLSKDVKKAKSIDELFRESDYISLHIPLIPDTKSLINKEKIDMMKNGVAILNFSRSGIVNNQDILNAVTTGKVKSYINDFPEEELLNVENILCIPHLGASTLESENNCAVMAVDQIKLFLETGNIKNSVNYPDCELSINGNHRITIINKNVPNMVGQITTLLAEKNINICDMINKNKNNYAYNIIDIDTEIDDEFLQKINNISGVIKCRKIR